MLILNHLIFSRKRQGLAGPCQAASRAVGKEWHFSGNPETELTFFVSPERENVTL
jgi:hypothetical protein